MKQELGRACRCNRDQAAREQHGWDEGTADLSALRQEPLVERGAPVAEWTPRRGCLASARPSGRRLLRMPPD